MPVKQDSQKISLKLSNGDSAEIYTLGATVTSFVAGGKERLYLSKKAALDGSAPIRGGIPICYEPFAGPPPSDEEVESRPSLKPHQTHPAHGFARRLTWNAQVHADNPEQIVVSLTLPISSVPEAFRTLQPTYLVTLAPGSLRTEFKVKNIGSKGQEVPFKALLHTYQSTDDSKAVKVKGLKKGARVEDQISGEKFEWDGSDLTLNKDGIFTQFVYGTGGDLTLVEGDSQLKCKHEGFDDSILFNPQEKAGRDPWPDMEEGDGKRFLCVEAGHLKDWIVLEAGEEFVGSQTLSI